LHAYLLPKTLTPNYSTVKPWFLPLHPIIVVTALSQFHRIHIRL